MIAEAMRTEYKMKKYKMILYKMIVDAVLLLQLDDVRNRHLRPHGTAGDLQRPSALAVATDRYRQPRHRRPAGRPRPLSRVLGLMAGRRGRSSSSRPARCWSRASSTMTPTSREHHRRHRLRLCAEAVYRRRSCRPLAEEARLRARDCGRSLR